MDRRTSLKKLPVIGLGILLGIHIPGSLSPAESTLKAIFTSRITKAELIEFIILFFDFVQFKGNQLYPQSETSGELPMDVFMNFYKGIVEKTHVNEETIVLFTNGIQAFMTFRDEYGTNAESFFQKIESLDANSHPAYRPVQILLNYLEKTLALPLIDACVNYLQDNDR